MENPCFLLLRDVNPEMVMAWLQAFADDGPWSIGCTSIVAQRADAIVSPANSYGHMDGGIDLVYRNYFGLGLQNRLQRYLAAKHDGYLPVGKAVILPTLKEAIPHLVVAPTMERPMNVSQTNNAYLAMRAVMKAVFEFNQAVSERNETPIRRILVPGMCTGIGRMDVDSCARQMRQAVDECLNAMHG